LGRASAPQLVNPKLWREVAGKKISDHANAMLEGRDLIIYTDSPVWAHVVSQQRISLLEAMRKRGMILDSAQVRNKPPQPKHEANQIHAKPAPIPSEASEALKQTAETIDNQALRLALLRLSESSTDAVD
jgi:hypothetical protein